jgi:hypothetical protein
MRRPNGLVVAALLISVISILASCTAGSGAAPPGLADRDNEMQQLQQKHDEREKALAAMDVPTLAAELVKDSERGREPFNSSAYHVMTSRTEPGKELAGLLKSADRSSLLGLLAVRQIDREAYSGLAAEFRIAVLVDALRKSETFNTWGLPHLYWEDGAKALIEEGAQGEAALRPVLKDLRPAPMWGEEEVVESNAYGYRVADYALGLILAIRGDKRPIPVDPGARDQIIAGL